VQVNLVPVRDTDLENIILKYKLRLSHPLFLASENVVCLGRAWLEFGA
jgi:hypothetical protein